MNYTVHERLELWLHSLGIEFDVLRHVPVHTSQEAADVRGTSLASGAKALVCKADGRFLLFVLPADRKLASKALRTARVWRSLRFATLDEVRELTGLAPGSIPPFGSLFTLDTWCDERLADQAVINFNAGDHSISFSMKFAEFVRAEQPRLALLSD